MTTKKWIVSSGKLMQFASPVEGYKEHACSQLARDIAEDYGELWDRLEKIQQCLKVLTNLAQSI